MAMRKTFGYSFEAEQSQQNGLVSFAPDPIQPVNNQPAQPTLDEQFAKLFASPQSEAKQDLLNRWAEVQNDIAEFLAVYRAAHLSELENAHDIAVARVRTASDSLAKAKEAEFAQQQKWTKLDDASRKAGELLQGAQHQFVNADHALHTRKEVAESKAFIEKLRKEAVQAQTAEGQAFNLYRELVAAREETIERHHAAVSQATSISRQIEGL